MIEPAFEPPVVSLIVATVGRSQQLDRMLSSLAHQPFKHFEVIVVDQNDDDRLEAVIERWRTSQRCIHIRSPRGLSRARNAGILIASGAIIGFPDDDCWYAGDLLPRLTTWFDQHLDYDFFCCAIRDEHGREVACRWPRRSKRVNRESVLRACASASFFIRKSALDRVGGFEERLGLGAATPYQSAEDSDLALRCIADGREGWFEKRLCVHHPDKGAGAASSNSRAFGYGMGFGCLLRRHAYPARTLLYHVGRALGGATRSLLLADMENARFYWQSAQGRWTGYFAEGAGLRAE